MPANPSNRTDPPVYIDKLAYCQSNDIGSGTQIWAFAHIMEGVIIGRDCNIGGHVFIESGAYIGHRVTIKNQAMIWRGVHIEDDVFIGPRVTFTNDRYPRSPRMRDIPAVVEMYQCEKNWLLATIVRRGASLGAGAVICPGVEIGAFAMVAAGAIVSKDVLPQQLVVGNPAQPRGWVCQCGFPSRSSARQGSCRKCGSDFEVLGGGYGCKS